MNDSKLHYADYLELNKILEAQHPESSKKGEMAHDEMLFIVIHQVYELWFKQILFEVASVKSLFIDYVDDKDLGLINARLERVIKILNVLVSQIQVIETMTPQAFLEFRDLLVPASGFQSLQFRLLETHLGLTWKERGQTEQQFFNSRLKEEERKILDEALAEKSLRTLVDEWLNRLSTLKLGLETFWDDFQKHLEETFEKDEKSIQANSTLGEREKAFELKNLQDSRESFEALFDDKKYQTLLDEGHVFFQRESMRAALFITLYQEYPLLHLPFKLMQNLVEIDKLITQWRYGHALMAKRMLGMKIGTGGSSGHEYLRKTAERHTLFRDLIQLSSFLLPKSQIPKLPEQAEKNLNYYLQLK